MKACKVFTSFGEVLTTEPDSDPQSCISGDEISRVEVEVPEGTRCDICDEIIGQTRLKKSGKWRAKQ